MFKVTGEPSFSSRHSKWICYLNCLGRESFLCLITSLTLKTDYADQFSIKTSSRSTHSLFHSSNVQFCQFIKRNEWNSKPNLFIFSPTFSLLQKKGAHIFSIAHHLIIFVLHTEHPSRLKSSILFPSFLFSEQFNKVYGLLRLFCSGSTCLYSTFPPFHTCFYLFYPNILHLFPIVSPPSVPLVLVFPLDWRFSVCPFQKLCFLFLCVPAVYIWVVLIAAVADCLLRTDSACGCCEGFVLLGLSCSWH